MNRYASMSLSVCVLVTKRMRIVKRLFTSKRKSLKQKTKKRLQDFLENLVISFFLLFFWVFCLKGSKYLDAMSKVYLFV